MRAIVIDGDLDSPEIGDTFSTMTDGSRISFSDSVKLGEKSPLLLRDELEWPAIGTRQDHVTQTAQANSSGSNSESSMSIGVLTPSTQSNKGAQTRATGAVDDMAATSQSSSLSQQGQLGASTSQSADDSNSSSSVINTTKSGEILDQSTGNQDQLWHQKPSISGWGDKQAGVLQSNPSTPRLDSAQSSGSQFTGWGQTAFPVSFSNDVSSSSSWGTSAMSSIQSNWGSQSPSLVKQQVPSSSTEWGMPSGSSSVSSQWGAPNNDGDDRWGQPKKLSNTGADAWAASSSLSANQTNPSNATSQPSQWGQPTSITSTSSSVWPTTSDAGNQPASAASAAAVTCVPSPMTSNSTASKQWGATSAAGHDNTISPTANSSGTLPAFSPQTTPSGSSTPPTSWAGAAAKGLPKPQPKPPEPVDPVQMQIEQSINNPEGWGKIPVRQDASWGKPPEKKNQDDSNQWQAAPNNGTAIWESSKNGTGQSMSFDDKSTWNQKVAGNTDPNVWNGEGSKGKDNALWDDVPNSKEQDANSQSVAWNGKGPSSRTVSQSSSGGDNRSDSGWPAAVPRSSPPVSQSPPVTDTETSWTPSNGGAGVDTQRQNKWDSGNGNGNGHMGVPVRAHSISDVGGTYWDGSAQSHKPAATSWNSKPNTSWTTESGPSAGTNTWGQSQSNSAGGWGDNPPVNQWNSSRKTSFGWEDNPQNGDMRDMRDRRQFKSESDAHSWDDTDMGDWNESNCLWSSSGGFKQSRRQPPIPENMPVFPSQKQFGNNGGGGGGNFGLPNGSVHGSNSTGQNLTKQQMLHMLTQMGFAKEDAHNALICNDMNLQNAISDLIKTSGSPQHGPGGPNNNDFKFNPSMPPPVANPLNTPFNNNAQFNQSVQTSSRMKANQPRNPLGGSGRLNSAQQQQHAIVQQLQLGVQMKNIHPQILNLPLTEQTLRSIQQLLNLQQTYQHTYDQLLQLQRRPSSGNGQQINELNQMLMNIKHQMKAIQQPLIGQQQMPRMPSNDTRGLDLSSLSLGPNHPPQSQSRLGTWIDKAPGSKHSAFSSPPAIHASNSTPNLQGNALGENNPWSNSAVSTGWSSMSPNSQFLDQSESHSGSASQSPNNRPSSQSTAATTAQSSIDIPEFIPGQPWQGVSMSKVENDPSITPAIARSISSTTASGGSSDWSNNRSTWSSQSNAVIADPWPKRPPPGFSKNMNRSLSMPQGPTEKNSAFTPVGSSWEKPSSLNGSGTWLVLRNLTPQIDGATLKTLCSQHGPLLNFFVNQGNGQALVQYATKQEGMKAHASLNSCVLGNTTIMTEFVDESEVQRLIDQLQRPANLGRSTSISSAPGTAIWPNSSNNTTGSLWGNSSTALPGSSSPWGGINLLDNHLMQPVDLLGPSDFNI